VAGPSQASLPPMTRLLVLGAGRMGSALVAGLLAGGDDPATITMVEPDPDRRQVVTAAFPGVAVVDRVVRAEGAIVAVKPGNGEAACKAVVESGTPRLVSIMAGVTLATLARWAPDVAVLRAMPNTPALVRSAVTALCGADNVGDGDMDWAESLLGAVGSVVRLPESAFDAVTGLSGSGPAYVFLVAEALEEAGVLAGLPRTVSRQLATATLAGAGRLLVEPGADPATLRADVTSPGGTTAAGLRVLERAAVRAAFLDAVTAAADRSRQLASTGE